MELPARHPVDPRDHARPRRRRQGRLAHGVRLLDLRPRRPLVRRASSSRPSTSRTRSGSPAAGTSSRPRSSTTCATRAPTRAAARTSSGCCTATSRPSRAGTRSARRWPSRRPTDGAGAGADDAARRPVPAPQVAAPRPVAVTSRGVAPVPVALPASASRRAPARSRSRPSPVAPTEEGGRKPPQARLRLGSRRVRIGPGKSKVLNMRIPARHRAAAQAPGQCACA